MPISSSTQPDDNLRKAYLWDALVDAGLPEDLATQFASSSQPPQPVKQFGRMGPLPGVGASSPVPGGLIGAAQAAGTGAFAGMTSGFGDEALVQGLGLIQPGTNTQQMQAEMDRRQQQLRADHPIASFAGNVAGAAANPVIAGLAKILGVGGAGSGLIGSMAKGAGVGAVATGLQAAGDAPAGQKQDAAVTGAKWGAALGAFGGAVGRGLRARSAKGEADKIAMDLKEMLDVSRQNPDAAVAQIVQSRQAEAAPYYAALDQANTQVKVTKNIRDLLTRPIGQKAVANVREQMANSGEAFPDFAKAKSVPWRVIDLIKKDLDGRIGFAQANERAVLGQKQPVAGAMDEYSADSYKAVRQALLDDVDKQPGLKDYATGREIWQEHSDLLNAIRQGRESFLKLRPEQLDKVFRAMSPDQQALFRVGAIQSLLDKVGKASEESKGFTAMGLGKANVQENIRRIAPTPQAAVAVTKLMMNEGASAEAINALRHIWGLGPILRAVEQGRGATIAQGVKQVAESPALPPALLRLLQPNPQRQ